MTTLVLAEAVSVSDHKQPSRSKVAAERRRRPLTICFGVLITVILFTTESRWPDHGLVREALFLLGIGLATAGMLGRVWSNLFISGYKSKELVQCGPYSMCRNPLYFFSAIGMVGIGLCSGTLALPAIMIVFFAAYYPMIIEREERRLAVRHPDEFEHYCVRTNAFWPRVSDFVEPDTYVMYPRAMRKNLADAFWFVAFAAIVHIVSRLHATELLPELFSIW